MARYRERTIRIVEAVQWRGDLCAMQRFTGLEVQKVYEKVLLIQTVDGAELADDGWWVIKTGQGRFTTMSPRQFRQTYEEF